MQKFQNISEVEGLPVVGRRYWVPCVRAANMLWPVLGPQHADPDLGAPEEHLHCDGRFMDERQIQFNLDQLFAVAKRLPDLWLTEEVKALGITTVEEGFAPLRVRGSTHAASLAATLALPVASLHPPTLHLRVCKRETPTSPPGWFLPALESQHSSAKAHDCRVCPHRGTPLTGLPVDNEGGVVCPAHGLRWAKSTGLLMPRVPPKASPSAASKFRSLMRENAGLRPLEEMP